MTENDLRLIEQARNASWTQIRRIEKLYAQADTDQARKELASIIDMHWCHYYDHIDTSRCSNF